MQDRDFNMDEVVTIDVVAERTGAKRSLIVQLARHGLIEMVLGEGDELALSHRSIVRLRKMQRLRRDLGVNFAGTAVILDLVGRIEKLNRELAETRVEIQRDEQQQIDGPA